MRLNKIIAVSSVSLMLFGCSGDGQGLNLQNLFTKQNIGTAAGAVGGAWVGSNVGKGKGQIVGVAVGTLLGAALGNSIGKSLDRADMSYYNQSSQYTLENARTGTTSTWSNPDSGNSGTITPTRTFQTASGSHCREYTQTITVAGSTEQAVGTACRQPDGSWRIVQ